MTQLLILAHFDKAATYHVVSDPVISRINEGYRRATKWMQ